MTQSASGSNSPSWVAVDVGNSQVKLGLFDEHVHVGSLPQPTRSLTLNSAHWETVEILEWLGPRQPAALDWRIASVRENIAVRLESQLQNEGAPFRRITYQHLSLPIDLPQPDQVGIDRLLAAVAADRLRPTDQPAIVIDLGTAITIDVVSVAGTFSGGAILPGIRTSALALSQQAEQLPEVDLDNQIPQAIGTTTNEAILSGLYWGAVGAIREVVEQICDQVPAEPFVVLTGGSADMIAKSLGRKVHMEPHLVLSGMALMESNLE
ncbi:MAG: type III pantothenate kinase [Planctomycetales bacterium]